MDLRKKLLRGTLAGHVPRVARAARGAGSHAADARRAVYHGAGVAWMLRVSAVALVAPVALAACTPKPAEQAMTLVRQDREPEAIAVLRADLAKHPADVDARRLLVRLLADSGDLPGAKDEVAVLEHELGQGDPVPWVELGHAYELAHRFEDALGAYDAAATVAPKSPVGPRVGGMRCARWGEIEEARPRLEEAVRRGGGDAGTLHTLGLVDVHLHDYAAAEQAYRAGAAADPNGAENWLGLATLGVIRGDPALALEGYDAVLARRPGYGAGELGRAWALARLGRKDDAARALDHAQELGAPPENIAKQRAALARP